MLYLMYPGKATAKVQYRFENKTLLWYQKFTHHTILMLKNAAAPIQIHIKCKSTKMLCNTVK